MRLQERRSDLPKGTERLGGEGAGAQGPIPYPLLALTHHLPCSSFLLSRRICQGPRPLRGVSRSAQGTAMRMAGSPAPTMSQSSVLLRHSLLLRDIQQSGQKQAIFVQIVQCVCRHLSPPSTFGLTCTITPMKRAAARRRALPWNGL